MSLQGIKTTLVALRAEYEAKKGYIKQCDKSSDVSMMYPEYAKISKKTFGKQEYVTVSKEKWESKWVSANEKSDLQQATKIFENNISKFNKTLAAENLKNAYEKISKLENDLNTSRNENYNLVRQNKNLGAAPNKIIKRIESVLDKMPDDMSNQFRDLWQKEKEMEQERKKEQSQSRGMGFSR